jgi:hypothetical protein
MGLAPVSALRDLRWMRCRMLDVEDSNERRAIIDGIDDCLSQETSPDRCYGKALDAVKKLNVCLTPPLLPRFSPSYI